jgi:hypothetical protein
LLARNFPGLTVFDPCKTAFEIGAHTERHAIARPRRPLTAKQPAFGICAPTFEPHRHAGFDLQCLARAAREVNAR